MENSEKIQLSIGLFLVLLLIASTAWSTSFFADDLGFDFAGYAVRYTSTFSGWVKNHHMGLPASTFDAWLPALLPLFFKFFGLGSFTGPLEISILLMKLLLVAGIVFLAREYKIPIATAFLIGAIVAVNPITFKFLNRYYELFAWVSFLFAAVYFRRYINSTNKAQSLFFAVLFSIITLLSHFTPALFLALLAVFSLKPELPEIKKLVVLGIFSAGISLFWLGPFVAYSGYSGITSFDSSALQTLGMTAASAFLILLLTAANFLCFKLGLHKKYRRETQLLALTTVLAVIKFAAPWLPLLNRPFTHSFHFFYIIVLSIIAMVFIKESKKFSVFASKKMIYLSALVLLIPAFFFLPKIIGNYAFIEPRFSTYELEGEKVGFAEIDAMLKTISKAERFEVLPQDPIVNAFAMVRYDLSTAYGWGYNIVALSNSNEKIIRLAQSIKESCELFNKSSREFGISKWIALSREAFRDLAGCGWKESRDRAPALFSMSGNEATAIIENGELAEYANTRLIVNAKPPGTLLKINYFPRWSAYSGTQKTGIVAEAKNNFVFIPVLEEKTVQLKYENTAIDAISLLASMVFFGSFMFFLRHSLA